MTKSTGDSDVSQFGCSDCNDVSRIANAARTSRLSRREVIHGAATAGAGAALGLGGARLAGAQDGTPAASPVSGTPVASPVSGTPVASPVAGAQIDPTLTEPVQSYPLTAEKQTLRVMIPASANVQDYATNDFTAWFEERTNVHVEWQVLPQDDGGGSATALNLQLVSGDYAEVLMNFYPSPSVLQLYGQQGTFVPLNDLIEQHGVYTKRAFETYPLAGEASTATDGNIYALPQVNDCYHCSMSSKLWINKEFLASAGMDVPTTLDEYAEVLRAFKASDPNGNGQPDELPLSGSYRAWHGSIDHFFTGSYLYHPGNEARLIVIDGQVTPVYTQEGWKEQIKYLAGLYQEGLIDAELFTRDQDQLRRIGDGNGGTAALMGSVAAGWFGEFTTYTPDAPGLWAQYTTVPPLEGPGGVRFSGYNPYGAAAIGSFIITDKCADPALALKWADALGEIEATTRSIHGVKDTDWTWANEGELGINGEQAIWKSLSDIANVPTQNVHWSQAGPSYRSSDYRLGQYVAPEDAEFDIEVILYNQTLENYEPYKQPESMALPPLYFSEDQAQVVAELTPTIQALVDQTFSQAVTGQINIDDAWQGYLDSLEGLGLSAFVQSHQEVFDARSG